MDESISAEKKSMKGFDWEILEDEREVRFLRTTLR